MKSASLAFILTVYFVDAFIGLRKLCPLEGMQTPSIVDRAIDYRAIGGANGMPCDNDAPPIALREFMHEKCMANQDFLRMEDLMEGIQAACKTIADVVRHVGLTDLPGSYPGRTVNVNREEKYENMNVALSAALQSTLQNAGKVSTFTAEGDLPVFVEKAFNSKYDVILHPFDGSSSIDASITTGTIFGIFEGIELPMVRDGEACNAMCSTAECKPLKIGRKLVAAGYCMYSSSTILVLTMGDGVNGFTLDYECGEFVLTHKYICIPKWGKIYSFNEAKYSDWSPSLQEYVTRLKEGNGKTGKKYSSRYIGGVVGDVHRTLFYGGIFGSPGDKNYPNGKLHLLYEAAPLSFIVEEAGGVSSTGNRRIMDVDLHDLRQRVPVFLGSPGDVNELLKQIR